MQNYLSLMQEVLETGTEKTDRTGTGTRSLFARQLRFDLREGFPLLTTKKLHLKSIIHELLWFLSGDTNINYLQENGVRIWDEWADADGNLGPVYGYQWRKWPRYPEGGAASQDSEGSIDQITRLVEGIKKDPMSRRHIVNAWNVGMIDKMALPPCHMFFQFYVSEQDLRCQIYCRSLDLFLGAPFNIASYALLLHMVAQQTDLTPRELILTTGDVHLYANHLEQAQMQLKRDPRPLPQLRILRKPRDIFSYRFEDFVLEGYDPHPHIKAPVAV